MKVFLDLQRFTQIPADALKYNGHYYKIFDESLTWQQAKARCEEMGGHLVTITNKNEQNFIDSIIVNGTKGCYWAGGYKVNDNWKWVTNEKFSYTNWGDGEPNDDGEDGIAEDKIMIYQSHSPNSESEAGQWNDNKNSPYDDGFYGIGNFGYICEWENSGISVTGGVVTATKKFTGSKIDLADYSGATKVNASAVTKNISIVGNAKKNTLRGGSGNDKLTGKGGADLFIFGAGNDTITDYVSGTDKISISGSYSGEVSGSNVILTTSKGTLTVKGMANKNLTINGKTKKFSSGGGLPTGLSYNSDKTVLTVGNNFTGGAIDLRKYASVYDVDAHKCKRMNLTITGNNFNNSLVGGSGDDTIFGGAGSDTLTGGAGQDIFKYSKGNDIITDYRAGTDKIKLSNTKITDIKVGENNIVFTTSTGTLKILNGAGKSVTIIDASGKETTQRYAANISELIADNSVGEFEFENKITEQENLITFAE